MVAAQWGSFTNAAWQRADINLRGYPDGFVFFDGVRGAGTNTHAHTRTNSNRYAHTEK